MTQRSALTAPLAPARSDNGILARVPGQYIALASRSLPDPACAVEHEMRVEIDAAWAGRVRLTFEKQRYCRPKAKTSYWAWHCRHAEAVAAPIIAACGEDSSRPTSPGPADQASPDGDNTCTVRP